MRERVGALICVDSRILLIHRCRQGQTYFITPGGAIEQGEGREDACLREVEEETGLVVTSLRWHRTIHGDKGPEHYFVVDEYRGVPELGGPEAERNCPTNSYQLQWVPLAALSGTKAYPYELKEWVRSLALVSSRRKDI